MRERFAKNAVHFSLQSLANAFDGVHCGASLKSANPAAAAGRFNRHFHSPRKLRHGKLHYYVTLPNLAQSR
jgi:hypothetical protein